MSKTVIVTDSSAQFLHPGLIRQLNVTIVPATIRFREQDFVEGVDLDAEGFFRHLSVNGASAPGLVAPSIEDYITVLTPLTKVADHIIVLPMAKGMSDSHQNAELAANELRGRCEIVVIDTMTVSAGLAFLAMTAAEVAAEESSLEKIVRSIRAAVPRIYAVFYVESLEYLFHNQLIGEAQSILGKMLNIKPFVTIEDGHFVAMEKVRTRTQAVDKLVEFVAEFAGVDRLVIVQNTSHSTEQARMIQDRLAMEFGGLDCPVMMYGPSLGTQLGPDGVGIIVHEAEDGED